MVQQRALQSRPRDPEAEQAGLRGVYECDVCQTQQVASNTVFADVHADRLCY